MVCKILRLLLIIWRVDIVIITLHIYIIKNKIFKFLRGSSEVFEIKELNLREIIFLVFKPKTFFKLGLAATVTLYDSVIKRRFFGFLSKIILRFSEYFFYVFESNYSIFLFEFKALYFLFRAVFCCLGSLRAKLLVCVFWAKSFVRVNFLVILL